MVSIIILNFNGKQYLNDCLNSVLSQTQTDFELIFFDNASSDESIELVQNNFKDTRVKIFRSQTNLGFAGGNNEALKHASGNLIVLLNNDTIVDKDWLKYLIEGIKSDSNIGIVQSLVKTRGIPNQYYEMNGTINLLGHNIMRVFPIDENNSGRILVANGCSMIIRRKTIEELGGLFPEIFFAYSEDTYLSLKSIFAGMQNIHEGKSRVEHIGNASSVKQNQSLINFYQERNRLLNFMIFFSGKFIIKYLPFLILNFYVKLAASLLSKNYSLAGTIKAYWWLIKNIRWIKEERIRLNNIKKINEKEVLKMISCKILNARLRNGQGNNFIVTFINSLSYLYCKIVNIPCMEIVKKNKWFQSY